MASQTLLCRMVQEQQRRPRQLRGHKVTGLTILSRLGMVSAGVVAIMIREVIVILGMGAKS
jgi:hypothetical protein